MCSEILEPLAYIRPCSDTILQPFSTQYTQKIHTLSQPNYEQGTPFIIYNTDMRTLFFIKNLLTSNIYILSQT